MMTSQQKLDFVHKQTKLALEHVQHFDAGGTTLSGPSATGTNNATNPNTNGIAGGVGSVLGTNNNFQASGANIQQGTNAAQLNNSYLGATGALGQAASQSVALNNGLNQGATSQNTLTNELTAESQGNGAAQQAAQSALNQNTGQNIAQQAALAASTRGAGANAGLVAQNAANTGASLQQTAVGQEATNQANNALAAQSQLQNLASTQVNQGTAATQLENQTQQGEQGILQNANTAANNAAVSQQENINSTNAQVAAGNQNSNSNLLGGLGSAVSGLGGGVATLFAHGGKVPPHLNHVAQIYHPHFAEGGSTWQNDDVSTGNINPGASTPLPQASQKSSHSGGLASLAPLLLASGGPAWQNAAVDTGSINPGASAQFPQSNPSNPQSGFSGLVGGIQKGISSVGQALSQAAQDQATSDAEWMPQGQSTSDSDDWMAKGGQAKNFKKGGRVQGTPRVNHDDYDNDVVDAKLTPGESVIDLDTLHDKGKLGKMARFVAREIERKKAGRKLA